QVAPRAGVGDAVLAEEFEGVLEGDGAVVEGVVVREGDEVEPRRGERTCGPWPRAEVEGFDPGCPLLAAGADGALEVAESEVGAPEFREEVAPGAERVRACRDPVDEASEHDVADEGQAERLAGHDGAGRSM